jgi:hypothetical protein
MNRLCNPSEYKSDWYDRIQSEMNYPDLFLRKKWEHVAISHILEQKGFLSLNKTGLGFGVGEEPLPDYFASKGCRILATDLDYADDRAKMWDNGQICKNIECLRKYKISSDEVFYNNVKFSCVDMKNLPDNLGEFDFTWSASCFEHIGSLKDGLDFVTNQLKYLKSGGISIHTTELNLNSLPSCETHNGSLIYRNCSTYEKEPLCLYRKSDIEIFRNSLNKSGYIFEPINYNLEKDNSMDNIIKLKIEGFVFTSLIFAIQKK